jgi:non-homologous end joining protein Ku
VRAYRISPATGLIEAKAKGKKITAPTVEKKTAAVKDLMSVLKESLNTHGKKKVA